MIYVKFCEYCKERFLSKSDARKYCSKGCKRMVAKMKQEQNEQLCWHCNNACGLCDWSRFLKPIKGWVAEPTVVKNDDKEYLSYRIYKCPLFAEIKPQGDDRIDFGRKLAKN